MSEEEIREVWEELEANINTIQEELYKKKQALVEEARERVRKAWRELEEKIAAVEEK